MPTGCRTRSEPAGLGGDRLRPGRVERRRLAARRRPGSPVSSSTPFAASSPGRDVTVDLGVMDERARVTAGQRLRARSDRSRLDSRRRVYAVASGKGGVGKSTVTAHLSVALAG